MRILMLQFLTFFLITNFSSIADAGGKSDSLNQGPAYLFTHPTGYMWRHVELCKTLKGVHRYEKTLKKLSWNDWTQLKSGNTNFSRSDKCHSDAKLWGEYFEQSLRLINELALSGIHSKSNRANIGVSYDYNDFASEGVMLVAVSSGSPAEAAGLEVGDVILKVNKWKIFRRRDAQLLQYLLAEETEVEVFFARNGIPKITTIGSDELDALSFD